MEFVFRLIAFLSFPLAFWRIFVVGLVQMLDKAKSKAAVVGVACTVGILFHPEVTFQQPEVTQQIEDRGCRMSHEVVHHDSAGRNTTLFFTVGPTTDCMICSC